MQKKQVNVKLSDDEMADFEKMANGCEVTPAALGGFFLRAAIRAVKRRPQKLTLPVDFDIVEEEEPTNETMRLNQSKPQRK
jgi:hypothetical protein